jgi:hypothetical protein
MSKSKKTVARAALDAKNVKRVKDAIAVKKASKTRATAQTPQIANLLADNTRELKSAIVESATMDDKRIAKAMSNAPKYSLENVIRDAMQGAAISGKAESGMVAAIFNEGYNGKEAGMSFCKRYFAAPMTQRVEDANGNKRTDTSVETRLMIQNGFLMQSAEFKTAKLALDGAKAELKEETKKKSPNVARVTELTLQIENDARPLLAAQQMFHRAMHSLFYMRNRGIVKCALGANNELLIETHEAKHETHNVGNTRSAGLDELKKQKLVLTRNRPNTNGANETPVANVQALSAVNAQTARPIVDRLEKMIEAGKLPVDAPVSAEGNDAALDLNKLAELSLTFVRSLDAKHLKSAELRGTLSQIALPLMLLLNVKTREEMIKLSRSAPNAA